MSALIPTGQVRRAVTEAGELFSGFAQGVECYVLDDGSRVVTMNGVVRALSGAVKGVTLSRYLSRIPNGSGLLNGALEIEFSLQAGGKASGIRAEAMADIFGAYAQSLADGTLDSRQLAIGHRCVRFILALAKIGIIALVDEATGYRKELSEFEYRVRFDSILRNAPIRWRRKFDPRFIHELCRLHGWRYAGGRVPAALGTDLKMIYDCVLGSDVYIELKRRNPNPRRGTNHHQWFQEQADQLFDKKLGAVAALMGAARDIRQFTGFMEHEFRGSPLQMGFSGKEWLS